MQYETFKMQNDKRHFYREKHMYNKLLHYAVTFCCLSSFVLEYKSFQTQSVSFQSDLSIRLWLQTGVIDRRA